MQYCALEISTIPTQQQGRSSFWREQTLSRGASTGTMLTLPRACSWFYCRPLDADVHVQQELWRFHEVPSPFRNAPMHQDAVKGRALATLLCRAHPSWGIHAGLGLFSQMPPKTDSLLPRVLSDGHHLSLVSHLPILCASHITS